MMSDLQARSIAETHLGTDEGFRDFLYDDATGQRIGPGSHVIGNPTIGYGWALNKRPMRLSQAIRARTEMVDEIAVALTRRLPWIVGLDATRRAALYELGYNLGVDGLLGFPKMLAALEARRNEEAAEHLLDSKWAREDVSPERSKRLAQALLFGDRGPS